VLVQYDLMMAEGSSTRSNRRAQSQRRPIDGSREAIIREEVADALAATPAERMEVLIALLDSAYELWRTRGLDRDEGLCRFPRVTQQRRRGLCSDRRDRGPGSRPVSDSKPRRYAITPVKGRPLRTDLDNVAEVIAEVEEDAFR
jgi:hypothetical protein